MPVRSTTGDLVGEKERDTCPLLWFPEASCLFQSASKAFFCPSVADVFLDVTDGSSSAFWHSCLSVLPQKHQPLVPHSQRAGFWLCGSHLKAPKNSCPSSSREAWCSPMLLIQSIKWKTLAFWFCLVGFSGTTLLQREACPDPPTKPVSVLPDMAQGVLQIWLSWFEMGRYLVHLPGPEASQGPHAGKEDGQSRSKQSWNRSLGWSKWEGEGWWYEMWGKARKQLVPRD